MITCPSCGTRHYQGALFCNSCGQALHPAAVAHLATVRPGARIEEAAEPVAAAATNRLSLKSLQPVHETRHVRVTFPDNDDEVMLELEGIVHIGRADPDIGHTPDLDLAEYDGLERGVSRRHASLHLFQEGVVLVDQHSSNGTWLDDRPLVGGYGYLLPQQAAVRLGDLLVYLTIED